jgi:hypothetical protein
MDYMKEYQVLIGAVLISIAVLMGAENIAVSNGDYYLIEALGDIENKLITLNEYLYDLVYMSRG